jgi:hypothetical protein
MSMIVIDEDHYVPRVVSGDGDYTLTRNDVGTRYVFTSVRTLVDPRNPDDLKQVHALQESIAVKQPGGPGRFDVATWDPVSQKKVRDLLKALGESLPDWNGAAGRKDEVDPVRHLIVTATGWGLNPQKDAIYLNTDQSVYRTGLLKACCTPHNPRGPHERESYDPSQPEIRIPRRLIKGGSHLCAPSYCPAIGPPRASRNRSTRRPVIWASAASYGRRLSGDRQSSTRWCVCGSTSSDDSLVL